MDRKGKNFKSGLDSLLQDTRSEEAPDEMPEKAARGRPKTSTREITKTSQEGTKEGETRATFIIKEDLLEKVKAIAYWDRQQIKSVISDALESYLDKKGEKYMQTALNEFKKGR
jgi:hypothetical protein